MFSQVLCCVCVHVCWISDDESWKKTNGKQKWNRENSGWGKEGISRDDWWVINLVHWSFFLQADFQDNLLVKIGLSVQGNLNLLVVYLYEYWILSPAEQLWQEFFLGLSKKNKKNSNINKIDHLPIDWFQLSAGQMTE